MIPVSAKEGLTYDNAEAYIAQFDVNGSSTSNGGEILFAFQEKKASHLIMTYHSAIIKQLIWKPRLSMSTQVM